MSLYLRERAFSLYDDRGVAYQAAVIQPVDCPGKELVVEINLFIDIDRPMSEVFTFMSDMENHVQEEDSNVLRVEKTTHGLVDVGAQYREVVQMFPLIQVDMISEVTRYEPHESIEFVWKGGGMEGVLRYNVESHKGGTRLRLHETITPRGIMFIFEPLIKRMFQSTLVNRLNGIKRALELSKEDPSG